MARLSSDEHELMLQTYFGITVPVSDFPLAPELAQALAERLTSAAEQMQGEAPAALAADLRYDAERYLAARRAQQLRLSPGVGRVCDDAARALMRLTVSTPPRFRRSELLVA
jgi:hypothetical protein